MRTVYEYLFFFLYNSINKPKNNILVQFKAVLVILMLELVLIAAFLIYFVNLFKLNTPKEPKYLFMLSIILPMVAIKIWFFEKGEKWKAYLTKYSEWPLAKQKRWNLFMRGIVFFVFANLILAFYWTSQIDWSQYN